MFRKLIIVLVITVLSLGLLAADSKEPSAIWTEVCFGGTWIIIDSSGSSEWSTWCGHFDPDAHDIAWYWGRSCNPSWGTNVVIRETPAGNPRAICKYK